MFIDRMFLCNILLEISSTALTVNDRVAHGVNIIVFEAGR